MARPKKQTIDYFPHVVVGGKTLFILENTFGNDGYAFWFKLLELLGSTEGHVYDINNSAEWRFLLAKTKVEGDKGKQILDLLAELGAIDHQLWQNGIVWSQNLVDNVADVYLKRKSESPKKPVIPTKEGFCDGNSTKSENKSSFRDGNVNKTNSDVISDSENPQSKVKESKVKESRVEERKEETPITPPLSFPTPYHETIYNQWTETTYMTWFMDTDIESKENEIVISVKSEFIKNIINEKFKEQLDILLGKKVIVSLKEI
jgi:hypothetical protein